LVCSDQHRRHQPIARWLLPKPQPNAKDKDHSMRKYLSIGLTLLALVGAVPLLASCNTTAGAGEDLSAAGRAVTRSADKHAP
jgi:predicted small secreted protein